ncbi:MAG: protein-disulfide reductase DsbD family protein [Hyphomicrobiales bacterium]
MMRTRPLTGLCAFVLGVALLFSWAAAQDLPLLLPAPQPEEDPVAVTMAWSADRSHPVGNAVLAVVLDIRTGYHVMADRGQQGEVREFKPYPTRVWVSEAPDGVLSSAPRYPKAQALKLDFVDDRIMGFEKRAIIYLPIRLDLLNPAGVVSLKIGVEYQACAPAYCLMPQRIIRETTLPLALAGETVSVTNAELFQDFDPRSDGGAPADLLFRFFGFGFGLDLASPLSRIFILLLAGFGGFLLNFTPCVLPLIPIKIISMSNAAGNRRRCLVLGLFTFAGVLAVWLGLGGIVSMVSGFTSANQLFQYPAFTMGVGLVITLMAVGLLGAYSVRLPAVIYALNPRQETLQGAFGIGMLTAVLSTPCTAPFMGTAAAWAATQQPAITLGTFAAIGAGMGLPYAGLAAFPRLVCRTPKTGPANELLKQVMAIFMLAAAAYFIGIGLETLMAEPGAPASRFHWWPVVILCAGAGAWTGIRAARLSTARMGKGLWAAVGAAIMAGSLYAGVWLTETGPVTWVSYTPERLAKAFKEDKSVVMVFTAEWCLNCKALEQSVWSDAVLAKAVSQSRVLAMKVDLTGSNPAGRAKLLEAGSLTIPLLVVYRPDGSPVFKGDFYTADQVLQAVARALSPAGPAL